MLVTLTTAVDSLLVQPTLRPVRSRAPSMGMTSAHTALKVAPRQELWNDSIKQAWISAYVSAEGESDYEIEDIEGVIPAELQGTIFRNGPGNFERGGTRYEHVLDGDGLVCRITIDGVSGRAHFRSRFVRTPEFEKEEEADAVLHRNTFGTQPPNWLDNVGVVSLKNAANTNVQVWGGALYALWEAAPPVRLDPRTLAPEQASADLGVGLTPGLTVTTGLEQLDKIFGLGNAFTAHPRLDAARGALVGWKWTAKPDQSSLVASVYEWDEASGALLHETPCQLPSAVAPHDFGVTASYYVFQLNAMSLAVLPFALGLKGPVDCLRTTGGGVTLLLVPRPGGPRAGEEAVYIETADPYFGIHHACALEEAEADGTTRVVLYTAGWPRVGEGPFLGDWGGAVPLYDEGRILPTLLFETTVTVPPRGRAAAGEKPRVLKRDVAGGACIDHPHVDPRFEGDANVRFVYMSFCADEPTSGTPPIGWQRYDRTTGEVVRWTAAANTFCEEIVVIPKPRQGEEAGAAPPEADEADAYLAGMMYDHSKARSCLAIFDAARLADGPLCRLWLNEKIPHGLHGCWTPTSYWGDADEGADAPARSAIWAARR